MKRCLSLAILTLVVSALIFSVASADGELRGYDKNGNGYQYVSLGKYPYEKDGTVSDTLWEILEVKDQQALLLSVYILDTQQVITVTNENDIKNYNYRRITDYAQSDLNVWMNDTMLNTLLGGDPMLNALVDGKYGRLYPLTDEQYLKSDYGFTAARYGENKKRQAHGTPYAIKMRGLWMSNETGTSTYWVAAVKSPEQYKLQCVGYNGHLSYGAYSRTNIGVRAALTLDLTKCTVSGGNGTKDEPFTLVYTGSDPVAKVSDPIAQESEANGLSGAFLSSVSLSDAPVIPACDTAAPSIEVPDEEKANDPALSEDSADPEPSNPAAAVSSDAQALTLSFIGDCSIGDATQSRSQPTSLTSTVQKNGYSWLFSTVSEYLKNDDYTFANLEVSFTTKDRLGSSKSYNMIAPPEHVQILLESGIDAVNTVNNHCMDFTSAGYQDTLSTLDNAQFNHFGTVYPGQKNGSDILGVAEVKGVKIGMIGFSYPTDSDQQRIKTRIETLKNDGCDLVVVSLHWGRETHMTSESWQYAYAKKIIDAGADVVWGHHPHVVQPIMFYHGKPIFFSTGNFIFGTMSKVDPSTGIFQLNYELDDTNGIVLRSLRVIPCQTTGKGDYRPKVLTDEAEKAACLKKLISKKNINGMVNLPSNFVNTGLVTLNDQGEVIAE